MVLVQQQRAAHSTKQIARQRPERSAKRQNATWRHSRCGRNQRRQRSKFRRSSCSIAELGFTIVLAVIASKVVGVLAYGLRRRNRPTIGGACGMYRPPIGPVSAIERAIVCMRMPGLADLRQPISRGFCTQLQAVAPPAFFTRAAVDAVRWWSWRSHGASAERLRTLLTATGRPGRVSCG